MIHRPFMTPGGLGAALCAVVLLGATVGNAQPAPAGARTAAPSETQTPGSSQSETSGPTAGEGSPETSVSEASAAAGQDSAGKAAAKAAAANGEAAAAAVATRGTPAPAGSAPSEPPAIEEEVKGTCKTPRQAWLQLLWWLQKDKGRWEPHEAAKCFSTGAISDPAEVARRATMLKETLDSRRIWIKVNQLPTNPHYRDNDSGEYMHYEPAVVEELGRGVYLEKHGDTWLFSDETTVKIPDLYPVTGLVERYIPSWLMFRVAGVEAWKYLLLLLVYVIARLVKWLALFVITGYTRRFIRRTRLDYLKQVVHRAEAPLGMLVMAAVFYISVPLLLLPIRLTEILQVAIEGVTAYSGVWLSYRLIDVLTDYMIARAERTASKLDDQLVPLVSKTLKVFVSVVGGIFILQNIGVNVGSLIAGLGLGGLAFALAAKDTIANFFGSVMIFIDKPFQIGDWVVIGNTEGIVEEVGFRTSRVRTFYNSLVTVPNAMITSTVVDNYGARKFRRYVANLSLTYDTPPDKVQGFCEGVRAIIAGMPDMRKDYYLVEFKEFGDSGLIIMVYCFMVAPTWNDELRTRTNLNLEIMRLAQNLGVSFAFPTQTLHVSSLAKLGESIPSHHGPHKPEELAAVINGFGPGGNLARPGGARLTGRHDCNNGPARGSDDDG